MALANVAELLYRRGLNVLMIDFDLEAPGLERFFTTAQGASGDGALPVHAEVLRSRGILDLLISYKALRALPVTNTDTPSESSPSATSAAGTPAGAEPFPYLVEPLKNFIVPVRGPATSTGGGLSLMPAGRRDDNEYTLYADRIRAFDWEDFFTRWNGAQFFDWFGRELNKAYDVILIDSRTGITEMSGVCTHFLADAVVLFVGANDQNVEGTRRMASSLTRKELITTRRERPLSILIVPSRVEINEGDKLKEFSEKFTSQLANMIDKRIAFRNSAFLDLRVPYIPYYAFGENVAVRDRELPVAADLIAASTRICSAMFELVPRDSEIYSRYQAAQANLPQTIDHIGFESPPSDFAGRDWVFKEIGDWLGGSKTSVLIVTGGPGTGKSAVAARVVAFATGATSPPRSLRSLSGNLVLAHSCRKESGWRTFLTALAQALASRSPQFTAALARASASAPEISVRVQQRIGATQARDDGAGLTIESISIAPEVSAETAFRLIIQKPLQEAANSSTLPTPMLILVDSLDMAIDASGRNNVAELLALASRPGTLPPNIRLLILTRPDPRILQIIAGSTIDLAEPGSAGQDILTYAEARLSERLPGSERREVVAHIGRAAKGNFLYAKIVLDGLLANNATGAQILANIDQVLHPEHIPDALREAFIAMVQQLVGFNVDRWAQQYRPFLGVLAVTKNGLTLAQLVGITRRPQSEVADSLRLLGNFLVGSAPNGPYKLFHDAFGTFMLSEPEYGVSSAEAHEAIATFFLAEYEQDWALCNDAAILRGTSYHLLSAAQQAQDRRKRRELLERLVDLLLQPAYQQARLMAAAPDELLEDLKVAAALADEHPRHAELVALIFFLAGNADELARARSQPERLAERLRAWRGGGVSAQVEGSGVNTPETVSSESRISGMASSAQFHDDAPAYPGGGETSESGLSRREEEALRRQIPASVRIELGVWRRAKTNGLILLLISVVICGALLTAAFGVFMFGRAPMEPLYWIIVIAAGYLLYAAWSEAQERNLLKSTMGPSWYADSHPSQQWETLPEILELRAGGKRYNLVGDVSVASPYFEIVVILFLVTLVVATISRNTTPVFDILDFFRSLLSSIFGPNPSPSPKP
jgi:cellulose biosynthesis protein BcsQ